MKPETKFPSKHLSLIWRQLAARRLAGGEAGIRTLGTGVSPYNGLANRRIRPLCHLSAFVYNKLPTLPIPPHPTFAKMLLKERPPWADTKTVISLSDSAVGM